MGAIPLINRPARVTPKSATLIDNILTTDIFNSDLNEGPFLASNIAQPNKTFSNFLGEKPNASINNEKITKLEFNKAIIELKRNKSCGYDGISSNVAIYVIDSICKPLFYLISSSFENSIFPDKLKLAKINLILKKGGCNNISNYRPISLLPVFSKVYERGEDYIPQ
ncbi:uncharacterized protein LOC136088375 [Hydra vulgaris]|uniref:Uncharacterized protein LOC136088375 n=1 Tax=Hydra vulgaris TaxID=6087 RepID=A0ABM4D1N2_HYDVU